MKTLLPFLFRFSLRAHVVPGLVFDVVALFLIKRQKYEVTPLIVQDGPVNGALPRQARHNRALTTFEFLPVFMAVNVVVVLLMVLFSQTKREYKFGKLLIF